MVDQSAAQQGGLFRDDDGVCRQALPRRCGTLVSKMLLIVRNPQMARRRKNQSPFLGYLIIIALIFGAVGWIIDKVKSSMPDDPVATWFIVGVGVFFIIVVYVANAAARKRRHEEQIEALRIAHANRLAYLLERFQDHSIVEHIMRGGIWHEMTKEQLIESWGKPVEIDTKVLKTKIKETYKYDRTGQNRFARRVYLDNDVVVGWEN